MIFRIDLSTSALATALIACLATPAFAQAPTIDSSFAQHHPRRTQVLTEDANLSKQINQDRGQLNGQYSQLQNTANAIQNQEEQYAAQNGGYITIPQWAQLDNEEANLQSSINNDYNGSSNQYNQQVTPWADTAVQPVYQCPPPGTAPSNLMSDLGGYTRQACGWAGNGGFGGHPSLPPTSTSTIDINVAF